MFLLDLVAATGFSWLPYDPLYGLPARSDVPRVTSVAMSRPHNGWALRGPVSLAGWWSRRITGEHRPVYRAAGASPAQRIEIAACRYRY